MGESDHLIDEVLEWERKFETANLENHKRFLQDAQLIVGDHPMEAAAWENGYVPEAVGLPSDQLESRIQGSLPPLAYMVSRPEQPATAGEKLLRRFDAGVRPYWLRDWQSGFGGYTKVHEYQVNGETRRQFSVAHVVRPRTKSSNACLCFTLMSKILDKKPWKRPIGTRDPSLGIILDLQENCDWKMPSTVMLHSNCNPCRQTRQMDIRGMIARHDETKGKKFLIVGSRRKNNKCRNPSKACTPQGNPSPPLRPVTSVFAHVQTPKLVRSKGS